MNETYTELGLFDQIRRHRLSEDDCESVSMPGLNDFLEEAFESEAAKQDKCMWVAAVYPTPGVGGGSIMWQRKKRFAKKREVWMLKMRACSMLKFFGGMASFTKGD